MYRSYVAADQSSGDGHVNRSGQAGISIDFMVPHMVIVRESKEPWMKAWRAGGMLRRADMSVR